MVRPIKKITAAPASRKGLIWAKALGLLSSISGSGLIGYKVFVTTPTYEAPGEELNNKVVVVTESTGKMSRDLIQGLAKRGAHVIMTSKSADDCEQARKKLLRATKVDPIRVECRRLDLESLTSVRRFSANLVADFAKIDHIVLQPPGLVSSVIAGTRKLTHDFLEHQMGTNYFASFLLSRLLISHLSPQGRVVFLADMNSVVQAFNSDLEKSKEGQFQLPLDNWNWDKDYTAERAFRRSQLSIYLFASILSEKFPSKVFLVDPRLTSVSESVREPTVVDKLSDFTCTLVPRKVSASALMAVAATPAELQPDSLRQPIVLQNLTKSKAYEESLPKEAEISEAKQILWLLSEKWSRLDTHPSPLPIPPK